MFGGNRLHGWWMRMAGTALTIGGIHPLLSQMGRSRDEKDGEFLDGVVGRVLSCLLFLLFL